MPKAPGRILALDPGTHKTGFAVFHGDRLEHHGVKVFTKRRSAKDNLPEIRAFVPSLIRAYKPRLLAVERLHFTKRTPRTALLDQFYRQILYTGRRNGVTVVTYAPSVVKKFVTGNGWANKRQVAEAMAYRYPELRAYLYPGRQWMFRHHANMFDAVAVAVTALHDA